MFPVETYNTHIERIQAAIGVDGPVADFYGQLQAVYSTMGVLDITKLLSEQQFIKFNREEIDEAFWLRIAEQHTCLYFSPSPFKQKKYLGPKPVTGDR